MVKKIFCLINLLLLSNCVSHTSSLLGPIFTGVKTGSVYQTGLSYSSSKFFNEVKNTNIFDNSQLIFFEKKYNDKDPIILVSYAVQNVKISEVIEPEPLP